MFNSSKTFGQSSSSPFGFQSVFEQTNNASNNPFAPKPFGTTSPFDSQTGSSIFGDTSTGVFGTAQSSSPFCFTTTFGASSAPAFGSSMPSFGASSTSIFCSSSSSSSFGGSSVFGQKPVFGSTTQQSQPAFGSNIFGFSTPLGTSSQSALGGTSTPTFGSTSIPGFIASSTPAFGSAAISAFGSTGTAFGVSSTLAFGSTASPAFGSAGTAFGVSSGPSFGLTASSTFGSTGTAFGVSSTPIFAFVGAFGASSPSVLGSSVFGQKPAFGSTTQQSQLATGSSIFGSSTPFGTSSQSVFGGTSTPGFSASSPLAFGTASSPAFGSTGTAFGVSSSPVFGSGGAFGASSSSVFGSSSTPAFGTSSTPAFGASRSTAFGAPSTPSFSFESAPAFGQSTSAFGSGQFGTTCSFGAQSSPFAAQSTTPTFASTGFGQSTFGGQHRGSRVTPYMPTTEVDCGSGTQPAGKLESISAMPVYKDKSLEELRWEDYQLGSSSSTAFWAPSTPSFSFWSTPAFGRSTSAFGSSPFGTTCSFGAQSSPFGAQSTMPTFASTGFGQSAFGGQRGGSRVAHYTPTTEAYSGSDTQPAGKLESISAMPFYEDKSHKELRWEDSQLGASSSSAFGASSTVFGAPSSPSFSFRSAPAFGQSTSAFGSSPFGAQSTTPTFASTGFGQSAFQGQRGGSRVAPYTPTSEADSGNGTQPAGKLESISAMPVYKDKSHEELRWEDYQLGSSSSTAFEAPSTPSFSFGSAPVFGQSTSAFDNSPFGTISSFGAQSSPFALTTTPTFASTGFGQSAFGGQCGGSRVASYTPTSEEDSGSGTQPTGKLESISAIPVYKNKSHEVLRWEDYQLGDKGGLLTLGQQTSGIGFGLSTVQTNPFASPSTFVQTSANPFSTPITSNPFAQKTPGFGGNTGFGTTSSTFGSTTFGTSSTSNPFGSASSIGPSIFGSLPSIFSSSMFGSSPSIFGSDTALATAFNSGLNLGSSQTSSLFNSPVPSIGQIGTGFGQVTSAFGQNIMPQGSVQRELRKTKRLARRGER